jgi:hypothetical protein
LAGQFIQQEKKEIQKNPGDYRVINIHFDAPGVDFMKDFTPYI